MNRSLGMRALAVVIGLVVLGGVALVAYQIGLTANGTVTTFGRAPYLMRGDRPFFLDGGLLGLILLGVIVALVVAALAWPRDTHHAAAATPGWAGAQGASAPLPTDLERTFEAWHQRAHGLAPTAPQVQAPPAVGSQGVSLSATTPRAPGPQPPAGAEPPQAPAGAEPPQPPAAGSGPAA